MTQTHIVDIEPRTAVIVRKTVRFSEMRSAQRSARVALDAALAAAGVRPAGPPLTVWRPPVDGAIDYAPGVFVTDSFSASGETTLFTLPPGRAAHLRFEGSHEGLPDAWGRLFEACRREGWSPAGLNWEVYDDVGPQPVTDLYALLS